MLLIASRIESNLASRLSIRAAISSQPVTSTSTSGSSTSSAGSSSTSTSTSGVSSSKSSNESSSSSKSASSSRLSSKSSRDSFTEAFSSNGSVSPFSPTPTDGVFWQSASCIEAPSLTASPPSSSATASSVSSVLSSKGAFLPIFVPCVLSIKSGFSRLVKGVSVDSLTGFFLPPLRFPFSFALTPSAGTVTNGALGFFLISSAFCSSALGQSGISHTCFLPSAIRTVFSMI